jgi:hypothetical protein
VELPVRRSSRLLAVLASLLLLATACGTDALGGAPATVDGEPVSREQLENAVRELAQDAPEDNRGPATEQIQRQVLTLLIQAKAIEQLADEQGSSSTKRPPRSATSRSSRASAARRPPGRCWPCRTSPSSCSATC